MKTKQTRPYRQGHLDGFCGLYSAINIVRYLNLLPSLASAEKLVIDCLEQLESSEKMEVRFSEGTDPEEMTQLLKLVIQPKFGIKRKRPFHLTSKHILFEDYVIGLRDFLAQGRGIVLVSLGGYHDHWSLIFKITKSSFHFYDSDGLSRLSFKNCQLENSHYPFDEASKTRTHILDPYHTHFLWVD